MAINRSSTDTPISIPDNTPGGITSSINVTESGTIVSGTYTVNVTHTRVADLAVYISDGITTIIGTESNSMFNQWTSNGGDSYTLSKGLFAFEGDQSQATWSVNVVDEVSGNTGTLESWSISIDTGSSPGVGDAALPLTASGAGYLSEPWGSAVLGLAASGNGFIRNEGAGGASLSLTGRAEGFIDWISSLSAVQIQEVYRLLITGSADGEDDLMIGGISSWQATSQTDGRSSYLQAVIPAADLVLPAIEARQNGDLVIQKGYRFADGQVRYEEIMRSRFDELRPDRGQRALTVTVSGYLSGRIESNGTRALTGIRSISSQNARRRVRCDIDLFLRPGMTVTALGESFRAAYINYYVTRADKFCEVGER